MNRSLRIITTLLLLCGAAQAASQEDASAQFTEDLEQAEVLLKARDFKVAIDHLFAMRADYNEHPKIDQLLAGALYKEGLSDLACDYYESAHTAFVELGEKREASACLSALKRIDKGIAQPRIDYFETATEDLLRASAKLQKAGDTMRALNVIESLEPWATEVENTEVLEAIEQLRIAVSKLDLEQEEGAETWEFDPTSWEETRSDRYKLRGQIEPEVLKRIGTVMDLVHEYYSLTFFPDKVAPTEKATIQIFNNHADMASVWNPELGPAPLGWWSPGDRSVTCYDTRTNDNGNGSIDQLLRTLFHEASHQFTTYLGDKGGGIPSWINEGTACYFEGIVVLGDKTVIPPEAAIGRLSSLLYRFPNETGESSRDEAASLIRRAVAFTPNVDEPKFPAALYSVAWGLVYFLRTYEDIETGAYTYRPLYDRYLEEIQTSKLSPMALFEALFLGDDAPMPAPSLSVFEASWRNWMRERSAMFLGTTASRTTARESHLKKLNTWVKASESKEAVQDLRLRLISDYAYIRRYLEEAQDPSVERYVAEVGLHEQESRRGVRFAHHRALAAGLIENLLRYAKLKEDVRGELLVALEDFNKGNRAVMKRDELIVKTEKRAIEICRRYQERKKPHTPRRALSFVREASYFVGDDVLEPWRVSFERAIVDSPSSGFGVRVALHAMEWTRIVLSPDQEHRPAKFTIDNSPDTGIDLELLIKEDDELLLRSQATATDQSFLLEGDLILARALELGMGGGLAFLFPDDIHLVFFFNEERKLTIKELNCGGRQASWNAPIMAARHLSPPIAPDEVIKLRVTLLNEGYIVLQVGERVPIQIELPTGDFEDVGVGVFAKGAPMEVKGLQLTRWQTPFTHLINRD